MNDEARPKETPKLSTSLQTASFVEQVVDSAPMSVNVYGDDTISLCMHH